MGGRLILCPGHSQNSDSRRLDCFFMRRGVRLRIRLGGGTFTYCEGSKRERKKEREGEIIMLQGILTCGPPTTKLPEG